MGVDADEAFGLQLCERFADRGRAHSEALRHVVLTEAGPGGEGAVLDLLAETFRHHLRGGISSERVLSVRHDQPALTISEAVPPAGTPA